MNIIREYGYKIDTNNILLGLKTVIHKGRMEKLCDNPIVIFDGAHNEPAVKNLLESVKMYYPHQKKAYVISILKTKDYKKMLELLSKDDDAIFILTSGNDDNRYTSKEELYNYIKNLISTDKIYKEDLKIAIENIMKADNKIITFCVGSFYVYETVIETIKNYG